MRTFFGILLLFILLATKCRQTDVHYCCSHNLVGQYDDESFDCVQPYKTPFRNVNHEKDHKNESEFPVDVKRFDIVLVTNRTSFVKNINSPECIGTDGNDFFLVYAKNQDKTFPKCCPGHQTIYNTSVGCVNSSIPFNNQSFTFFITETNAQSTKFQAVCNTMELLGLNNGSICVLNDQIAPYDNVHKCPEKQNEYNSYTGCGSNQHVTLIESEKAGKYTPQCVNNNRRDDQIIVMRKCCHGNEKFNRENGKCVQSSVESTLTTNLTMYSIGQPVCNMIHEAVVVYHLSEEQWNFRDNEIVIDENITISSLIMSYCMDEISTGGYVVKLCQNKTEVCAQIQCFRKCFDMGYQGKNETKIFNEFEHPVPINVRGNYALYYVEQPKDQICDSNEISDFKAVDNRSYCIELADGVQTKCVTEQLDSTEKFIKFVKVWGSAVSITALIANIFLYWFVGCHTLADQILMGSMIALIITYASLIGASEYGTGSSCTVFAYCLYISVLSAFSWMNVISFQTFIDVAFFKAKRQKADDQRLFRKYLAFAIAFPICMAIIIAIIDNTNLPHHLKPNLSNDQRCFFEESLKLGHILFFIAPITIQIVANIFFFTMLSILIWNMDAKLKDKRYVMVTQFKRNFKLFLTLGIPWIFDIVVTFLMHYNIVWLRLAECLLNSSQGVFFFAIHACNVNMWNKIKGRLGISFNTEPLMLSRRNTEADITREIRVVEKTGDRRKD